MGDKIDALINILFDSEADIEEQDDAAIDLGYYNDDKALLALENAACDPNTDEWCVLQTCGESAARIWVMRNSFVKEVFDSFRPSAQMGAYFYLKGFKPEWIEKYNIRIDAGTDNSFIESNQ